jgi:hypothetical protein
VRFCQECKAKNVEKQQKRRDNVRTVVDISGNTLEEPIKQVRVSKAIRFRAHVFPDKLTADSPSGQLIEIVKGFCLAGAECLSHRDAQLCHALLRDLQNFEHRPAWHDEPPATVQTLPIQRLNYSVEDWIMSHFNEKSSVMMPHYALAAADLIAKLIRGYSSNDPEPWEVESLFGDEWYFDLRMGFFETSFKKRFSEACQSEVIARVPNNVSLVYDRRTVRLESGDSFVFKIKRCHLSNVINNWTYLKAVGEESSRPRFDLFEDFLLKGCVLSIDEDGHVISEVDFHLPPHWVIAERYYDGETQRMKECPLPKLLQLNDSNDAPPLIQ